jgi:hypothetical protein
MAVLATSSTRFSALVKHEYEPSLSYCREVVTVNDSAQTLKVGAVLGKVTGTGKYKLCASAAGDGSQTPAAIVIADGAGNSGDIALANATDTKVLVLVRGPVIVADSALQLGTGTTASAVKSALAPVGILVETAA